ncbi:hypothetical protein SO802_012872 [Lithocarpus litseifolius]|uniref:Uncharacterized protein n=1 Tax=Lithocarpus litseifolius TaxID=425828 RepID=A0AAW2D801_9ROSI
MVGEREMVSEVRSSELENGLLSSDDPIKAEVDTTTSGPSSFGRREIRSFRTLREECDLDANTLFRFRDRFQFPKKEVDKEMEADEAAQATTTTKENVPEEDIADPKGAPTDAAGGDEAAT